MKLEKIPGGYALYKEKTIIGTCQARPTEQGADITALTIVPEWRRKGYGSHGSTFGGNPVCCAGALAVLDTMDEAFLAQVRERAAQLRAGLAALPHVQQVSGLGLMVGIELADGIKAAEVRAACEREGLLVLTAKTRLRLLPPLILTADDVDDALAILRSVLEKCV